MNNDNSNIEVKEKNISDIITINANNEPVQTTINTQQVNQVQQNIPIQEIKPVQNEINNKKIKEPSNFILFFILFLLGATIFFLDDIIDFFSDDISFSSQTSNNKLSNNLINGYIQIGQENSYVEIEGIKFYNFKTVGGKVNYNYLSNVNVEDSSKLGIYIQIYDNAENLIYKHLFNEKKLTANSIKQSSIQINNFNPHYTKIVKNTGNSNEKTSLSCTIVNTTDNNTISYSMNYNFKNDFLESYSVARKIEGSEDSEAYNKLLIELEIERQNLQLNNIKYTSDTTNQLSYNINSSMNLGTFNPYYTFDNLKYIIKNKEEAKGWTCQ